MWEMLIIFHQILFITLHILVKIISLQTGGYTTANYIWDLMQARKIIPSFPAVEAYYNGLRVSLPALIIHQKIFTYFIFFLFHF